MLEVRTAVMNGTLERDHAALSDGPAAFCRVAKHPQLMDGLPSDNVSPIISGEYCDVVLPRALTSCIRMAPSGPVSSTMTRHLIPLS